MLINPVRKKLPRSFKAAAASSSGRNMFYRERKIPFPLAVTQYLGRQGNIFDKTQFQQNILVNNGRKIRRQSCFQHAQIDRIEILLKLLLLKPRFGNLRYHGIPEKFFGVEYPERAFPPLFPREEVFP